MRSRLGAADEQGMTLIELVIAISILGIIVGPIMISFLIGLLEANSTRDRVADSTSAQLISAYLLSDVQSSQNVFVNRSDCLPAPFDSNTDNVMLQLEWADPLTPANTTVVSYIDRLGDDGAQHELHRAACSSIGGVSNVDTTLLAHYLDAPGGFTVTCVAVPADPTCSGPKPKAVRVEVKARSLAPQTESSYVPFEFNFESTRRVGQ
jgi:prepilin-type N-terminal cleavage/methylation domain-containing protein